jgi:hypothetical protein
MLQRGLDAWILRQAVHNTRGRDCRGGLWTGLAFSRERTARERAHRCSVGLFGGAIRVVREMILERWARPVGGTGRWERFDPGADVREAARPRKFIVEGRRIPPGPVCPRVARPALGSLAGPNRSTTPS